MTNSNSALLALADEGAIGWLTKRGLLDERQSGAARKLQNRRETHPAKFAEDMAEIGSDLSGLLWHVVIAGEGLREAETRLGWPARSGKLVLGIALTLLADRYDRARSAQ